MNRITVILTPVFAAGLSHMQLVFSFSPPGYAAAGQPSPTKGEGATFNKPNFICDSPGIRGGSEWRDVASGA